MTLRGPAHYAPLVRAGLDARRDELQRQRAAARVPLPLDEESDAAPDVTDADALLAMAEDAVAAEGADHPAVARRRRPQLVVHVDPLTGWGRQADGELLPPASLRAVLRSLPGRGSGSLRPVGGMDVRRFDLGRSQREVSDRLRELLGTLDGERCRFPGCTRHRKLHAHHVLYWSLGGRTDLGKHNLKSCYRRRHGPSSSPGSAGGHVCRRLHPDQLGPQRHRAGCRSAAQGLPHAG